MYIYIYNIVYVIHIQSVPMRHKKIQLNNV